jgi:AcrR family transcriptional regulator
MLRNKRVNFFRDVSEEMDLNQKKKIIIKTFRDLCIQYGIDHFSMQTLSDSCGFPIGTIYNIFENRTEIFRGTLRYCYNVIYEGLSTYDHFTVEALKIKLHLYINNALNNKNDFLFFDSFECHPLNQSKQYFDEFTMLGDSSIGALMENNTFFKMSPYLIITIMVGIVSKSIKYIICNNIKISEENINNLIQAIIRATVIE